MSVDVKVPSVGESITEGTIARWLKKDGEIVRIDEPLFELETEKATSEVAAPAAGKLHIAVPEGQKVAIGAVVGGIEATTSAPQKNAQPAPAVASITAPTSPAVRRIAAEENVDVATVRGTGPRGRITKEDLVTHVQQKSPPVATRAAQPPSPAALVSSARQTRKPMSAIRQRIAERLVAAQSTAAILTSFNEVDMSAVIDCRQRYKDAFQKKYGVGLGFMSFFVKSVVEALRAYPIVNAFIDGSDIVYHKHYDIGVAVSTDKGLMVPVVRGADELSFAEIEKHIAALAEKARSGKIAVNDLQGGTFTITNGGVFGSLLSTPILNPPQSGILGMHTIQKRPVAINDQVAIRPMMYLALSYDHRLIDGREAVLFLVRIKECIEAPERLLLEV